MKALLLALALTATASYAGTSADGESLYGKMSGVICDGREIKAEHIVDSSTDKKKSAASK